MEKKVLTEDLVTKIKEILSSNENKDSLFAGFKKDSKKCLIYPTDDIHLSKEQFLALTRAINEKSYYVMQLEEINQIFSTGNCIFEISSYDDYERVYDEYEKNIEEFINSLTLNQLEEKINSISSIPAEYAVDNNIELFEYLKHLKF